MVNNRIISSMKSVFSGTEEEQQQGHHPIELPSSAAATGDNIDFNNNDDI
jgi:hypothetical protein